MANYDDIYNRIYGSMEDQYTADEKKLTDAQAGEQGALDTQKKQQQEALDAQKTASDTRLKSTRDDALRQAYIGRRQNERSAPGLMAAQGLSGGPSETAIASIMRGYQNARNAANKQYGTNQTALDTEYTGNSAEIESNYTANAAALGSKYAQMLLDLQTQRRNEAINQAQLEYQAELQKEKIEWEKEQLRQQQAADAAAARNSGGTEPTPKSPPPDDYIETGGAQGQAYTGGVKPPPVDYNYSYRDPKTGKWVYK